MSTSNDTINLSVSGSTKGDLNARKRVSLLNLNEEEIILKYCELRAKYDNLLEGASSKVYELQNRLENTDTELIEQSVKQITNEKMEEIQKVHQEEIDELNKKLGNY